MKPQHHAPKSPEESRGKSADRSSKTVIVTGASRGIGKAITRRMLEDGYAVHAISQHASGLESLVREIGNLGELHTHQLDLSDPAAVKEFIMAWNRPVYGIVNNAGVCKTERIDEDHPGTWDAVMSVNLDAVYQLTKGISRRIEDAGRIITISSQLGTEGRAGYAAYCASKFGVIGLTKCWAKELGPRGITVNAVCPGWVSTEMSERDLERLADERGIAAVDLRTEISQPLELKRFTTPDEVAHLVGFLISPRASGITGRDWLMHTVWNQE